MRRLAPLACLLIFAAAARAEAPKLVAPERVDPYKIVHLRVDGEIDSAVFAVEPYDLADVDPGPDGRSGSFTGPPGVYTVRVTTLRDKTLGQLRAVVTIGPEPDRPKPKPKPRPKPPAPPKPDPPPSPAPAVGTIHVTLVTDLDALTPDMTAVRVGLAIRPALAGLDALYRVDPITSPELDRLGLRAVVAKVGVPALIVQDSTGVVIAADRAPTSEAAVIAKIQSLRGVR